MRLTITMKTLVKLIRKHIYFFSIAFITAVINGISLWLHFTTDFQFPSATSTVAIVSWLASIILFGFAVFLLPFKKKVANHDGISLKEKIFIVYIFSISLCLRLYKIKHQPLYLDEWFWITNAKEILSGIVRTPFGFIGDQPSNLPAYIVAAIYTITKDVYLAVRLPGVLYSLGTMYFLFFFLKDAYNKKVAFFSLLLLGTSIWDIHMSQLGWNNVNLNPFLISGTLYFLYRSIKYQSFRAAFLCGIFLGISINLLYIAALSTILVGIIAAWNVLFANNRTTFISLFLVLFVTTFLTMSPTIAKIIKIPEQSILRHQEFLEQNVTYSKKNNGILYYVEQSKLAIQDLGYEPSKYTIPLLWGITIEPLVLFFFVIGVLYVFRYILYFPNVLLLLNYIVMMIPVVILHRYTSIWREYGFVPALYSIASLGAYVTLQTIAKPFQFITKNKSWATIISFTIIVIFYIIQWVYYFHNHYYLSSLKDEPISYEAMCRSTTSYIQKNISHKTELFFPDGLCAQLITIVLDEKYTSQIYLSLDDLQTNIEISKNNSIIVFVNNDQGVPTDFNKVNSLLVKKYRYVPHSITAPDGIVGAFVYSK